MNTSTEWIYKRREHLADYEREAILILSMIAWGTGLSRYDLDAWITPRGSGSDMPAFLHVFHYPNDVRYEL